MGLLRTLLALSVVFAHSPWNGGFVFVGGQHAVRLFYMISGFLISHVVLNNPVYRDPLRFYASRWLRLFPVYYVVAILALTAHLGADPKFPEIYAHLPPAATALLMLSNALLFGQDWVMFFGVNHGHLALAADWHNSDVMLWRGLLIPPAWTLGVELSFYVLAPFIVRSKRVIVSLLALSIALRVVLWTIGLGDKDPWNYRFFPAELSLFLLGVLSNQYLLPLWKRMPSRWGEKLPIISTAFLVCSVTSYFLLPVADVIKTLSLFICFFVLLPGVFIYQGQSRLDKSIGELSYPIYIVHILVVMTVTILAKNQAWLSKSNFLVSCMNVCLSIGCAFLLNKIVAEKVEALRLKVKTDRAINPGVDAKLDKARTQFELRS